MPFQMVDPDGRTAPCIREASRDRRADQQSADQAGAGGVRNPLNLPRFDMGFSEGFFNKRQEFADVIPGRELRYNPAVGRVYVDLAE
jgi:hypothetical protein